MSTTEKTLMEEHNALVEVAQAAAECWWNIEDAGLRGQLFAKLSALPDGILWEGWDD